jgi:hypothetical protein
MISGKARAMYAMGQKAILRGKQLLADIVANVFLG